MSRAYRNSHLTHSPPALNPLVERGRAVLRSERAAIEQLIAGLDDSFAQAVAQLLTCRGCIVVSGMGKAGIVGQKLSASLCSTGTPSRFLHPAEAVHGDVGGVRSDDVALLLSTSGETEELLRLLPIVTEVASSSLAITSHADSSLARQVDLALLLGHHREACHLGLAPSCSTTAMLALGDALALVVSQQRGFTQEQFAKFHPAGNLGKRLSLVDEVMRPLGECRLAGDWQSVREVLIHVGRPGRRTGATMLTNAQGQLSGIFTDSDLARLLEASSATYSPLDQTMAQVMTRQLQTVASGARLSDAVKLLTQRKISELPVVSTDHRPLGLIDITDVMSVMSDGWERPEEVVAQPMAPQIFPFPESRSQLSTTSPTRQRGIT